MSSLRFPHLVRGLLVVIALLFAVIQLALLASGPRDRLIAPAWTPLSGAAR